MPDCPACEKRKREDEAELAEARRRSRADEIRANARYRRRAARLASTRSTIVILTQPQRKHSNEQ